jgi:hypothetical protein
MFFDNRLLEEKNQQYIRGTAELFSTGFVESLATPGGYIATAEVTGEEIHD